jgi:hypothetical protein
MMSVVVDRQSIPCEPGTARNVGEYLKVLASGLPGRIWTSVLLNGHQPIDLADPQALSIPLEEVSRLEVETLSTEEAVNQALASAAQVSLAAAALARRASAAFERGEDAVGHQATLQFCRLAEDLDQLAGVLPGLPGALPQARSFLATWTGPCARALAAALSAREAGDYTLFADHLFHDVASALERLAEAPQQGLPLES